MMFSDQLSIDSDIWSVSCDEWQVVQNEDSTLEIEKEQLKKIADECCQHANMLFESPEIRLPTSQLEVTNSSAYELISVQGFQLLHDELGDVYCGEIIDGKRHGQGVLKFGGETSADYYSGGWYCDARDGYGIECVGEEVYQGEWADGVKQGVGEFLFISCLNFKLTEILRRHVEVCKW